MLSGPEAFYKQEDYVEKTTTELSRFTALPPSYIVEFESKIVRVAKFIFSLIVFPVFIYNLLHKIFGRFVFPATLLASMDKITLKSSGKLELEGEWKFKRFSIEVDGCVVDACLMGKDATIDNGRVVLRTVGNAQTYTLSDSKFEQFLTEIQGSAVLFDVPGVGASTGGLDHSTLAKSYRAMLKFLEDQNGLAAKEIIGYGFSIGAAVQAEGLLDYPLHNEIDHVFIKDRTFATIGDVGGTCLGFPLLGFIANVFMWNVKALQSSIDLKAKEIIIQTVNLPDGSGEQEIIDDSSLIIWDEKLPPESTLAKALLDRKKAYPNKVFVGTKLNHKQGLIDPSYLADLVKSMLVRKL